MSAGDPVIRVIGDREYRVLPFGFDAWVTLTGELAEVSGPLAGIIAAIQQQGSADVGEGLQGAARGLLSGVRSGLLDRLCGELTWNTKKDQEQKDSWTPLRSSKARNIWTGNYFEGIEVIAWVLEVAFSGFWTAATARVPELLQLLEGAGQNLPERTELPAES